MLGPSGKPLLCGIYQQSFGVELRAGYDEDDVVRTQWALTIYEGRELAQQWRQASLAKGFSDVP